MSVKPVPDGYPTVIPYLIVKDGRKAIDFYKRALGAVELMKFEGPDGKIGHAEIKIGDTPVMLADEYPDMGFRSPNQGERPGVNLHIYTADGDRMFQQAISAGAEVIREMENKFYGDRSGTVKDPFGHIWTVSTHIEDVSMDEISKRMEE